MRPQRWIIESRSMSSYFWLGQLLSSLYLRALFECSSTSPCVIEGHWGPLLTPLTSERCDWTFDWNGIDRFLMDPQIDEAHTKSLVRCQEFCFLFANVSVAINLMSRGSIGHDRLPLPFVFTWCNVLWMSMRKQRRNGPTNKQSCRRDAHHTNPPEVFTVHVLRVLWAPNQSDGPLSAKSAADVFIFSL